MTSFEWLTIAYLAGLVAAAWGRQSPRRLRAAGYAAVAVALVIVARFTGPSVRAWLPHAYLVLGYWLPALLTPVVATDGFERRLVAADARLRCAGAWHLPRWTSPGARSALRKHCQPAAGSAVKSGMWQLVRRGARGWFELAYLLCYPLVPLSFTIVWMRGTAQDTVRFWFAVLTAGFACYGMLPWTAAWPPRMRAPRDRRGLAAINVQLLQRFSHGFNTFPSGHVAVAVAASLAVASVWPLAGVAVGVIAASIAIAAAAGRYHYVVDVVVGLVVGLLAWTLTCRTL